MSIRVSPIIVLQPFHPNRQTFSQDRIEARRRRVEELKRARENLEKVTMVQADELDDLRLTLFAQ